MCEHTTVCVRIQRYLRIRVSINPLHPKISIHILHTVFSTFPKVLIRRFCRTIKSFCAWWSFPLFSWPQCLIQEWYCEEKLDASHSLGLQGYKVSCILFPIHFLRYWQGDFAEQSRAPVLGDHFRYSRDLNVWFRSDIVRRN